MRRPFNDKLRPRSATALGILSLSLSLIALLTGLAQADERPNIILLMGDDHGWDETGYNGHPHLKTPVLDQMAASGLRLDHFYSAHPSCSPTRGSVLTGRHPNRYGTFAPNWSIRPEEITIAQIVKQAGYARGHFGKWHVGPVKAESPTSPGGMGFEQWLSHDNFFELNPSLSRNGGPPTVFPGESSEILVEQTIRFIADARSKKQPFLAVVWFGSPHEPYSGLEKDLKLYDSLLQEYPGRTVRLTSNETGRTVTRPLGEVLRERYAEITAMDRAIGTLRDYLAESGLRDNTLLWYCGDNGSPSGASVTTPFRGEKGQMYEGGVRVPGIIEWPRKVARPATSRLNCVTSDMLPTICELLGQPLPARPLDGVSLIPLLNGEMTSRPGPICFWSFDTGHLPPASRRPYIPPALQEGTTPLVKMMGGRYTRNFVNFHHPTVEEADYAGPRVILDGDYKLLIHGGSDPRTARRELFHLGRDPAEKHNLAERESEIAERLAGQLRAWQQSVLQSLTGADYR